MIFYKKIAIFILSFSLLLATTPLSASIFVPNDKYFNKQWHHTKIQSIGAWEKGVGSPEVVVAILDTGIDLDHPDLAGRIWKNSREQLNGKDDDNNGFIDDVVGWDFIDNDNDPRPNVEGPKLTRAGANHGTILAGIIGAITGNDEGIAGINWKVRLMPIRVLDSEGVGSSIDVEKGIRYAKENGADIINLSFVGNVFYQDLYDAVFEAWKDGIVVVAAAGNNSMLEESLDATPLYPACFSGPVGENIILGVGAVDRNDVLADFSNFGKKCVDVLAPGVGIFSTQVIAPGNTIFREPYGGGWSGTSVAAATVSGVAALIKSYNRDLSARAIIRLIVENSESIDVQNRRALGRGRLNAFLAMQAAEDYVRGDGRSLIKKGELIAAPAAKNHIWPIRIFNHNGSLLGDIQAYGNDFHGGVFVDSGDLNNDGFPELITSPLRGGGPHIRIWQSNGKLAGEFFAYEKEFTGGTQVIFADIDGNGSEEIITAPYSEREAEIRIWTHKGDLITKFLAFPENYKDGINIGAADFDRDGQDELVVAPRGNHEGVIRIYRPDGILISEFKVLPNRARWGVEFALGDLNGDGWTEIMTTSIQGSPLIRVWNYIGRELRPAFFLTPKNLRGIKLISGDTNNDGKDEIIIGSTQASSLEVRIYDMHLKLKNKILVYPKGERNGVNVAVVK